MTYRKWNRFVAALMIIPVMLIAVTNYIIDPFDVFHSHLLRHPFQFNERFNKIEHLKFNHQNYNSYLLGSSRMGTTDPKTIEKYIPGSHFYNLTVAGCTQYDNLKFLEFLIHNHYPVKNLYLQIDITDIYGYTPQQSNYSAHLHPEISEQSYVRFYLDYLTTLPFNNWWGKIRNNFFEGYKTHMRYDIAHSGRWYVDHLEEKIQKGPDDFIRSEPSFNKIQVSRSQIGKFINQNIAALKRIKKLSDQNNINLIVFVAPHNHNMMNTFHTESYLAYLKKIAAITPFWDFSGYNPITLNNRYYYEMSHYRTILSELVAARIFRDCEILLPKDFGTFVDTNSIASHLTTREKQIVIHDKRILSLNDKTLYLEVK